MAFPSCVISNHGPTMTRRDENPCPDGRKNYFPSDMGESFTIVGKVGWKSFESLAVEPTFDIFFMTKIKLYEVLLFFFEIGQEWVISLRTSETPLVRWFFLLWWEDCWFNQKLNTSVLAIVEVVFRQKNSGDSQPWTLTVPLFETPLWFSVFSQPWQLFSSSSPSQQPWNRTSWTPFGQSISSKRQDTLGCWECH